MKDNNVLWVGIMIGLVSLVIVGCLVAIGAGAFMIRKMALESELYSEFIFEEENTTPTATPEMIRPTDDINLPPQTGLPYQTLTALEDTLVPEANVVDLANRLLGIHDVPETAPDYNAPYQVGAEKSFWVTNGDTHTSFQVETILQHVTDHLYVWIENDVDFDEDELADFAQVFEEKIYPTNREFFGSEWTPGIDNDPHIYMLYVRGIGGSVAGYFGGNESHPLASKYSNAHELFVINAENTFLGTTEIESVAAHEFQHMIHWNNDANENLLINEGFSVLSQYLNGYDSGGFDFSYIVNTDDQMNIWPNEDDRFANYGSSFLYMTYFLDRFGKQATQKLVAHPENGLKSVDAVLQELGIVDPLTGQAYDANALTLDWALANYLGEGHVGDGRYVYHNYPDAPQAYPTETFRDCPEGNQLRSVNQYGVDYIQINCPGEHVIEFSGTQQTRLLPDSAQPYSGDFAFWTNKGDNSDMTLTRKFDFTDVSGPLTFTYWTWYDIETNYDYAYLLSSSNGEDWEIFQPPSATSADPTGNNYGWGYNDLSGDGPVWIQESVDISHLAGEQAQLRFEYITDTAINGEGLLVDDIAIPETGYFEDFEGENSGWQAGGFVRVSNMLPQTFKLALITFGDRTAVEYIQLMDDNTAEIKLDIGADVDEAVLVVIGTTRYTRQPAAYQFKFSTPEISMTP